MIDITNEKYGLILVLSEDKTRCQDSRYRYWRCLCECGNEVIVRQDHLRTGNTKSCGCLKNTKKYSQQVAKVHKAWVNMKSRCYSEKSEYYKHYGGRGIKVCDRWLESFENFYEDMGDKPSKDHSLDRIDNDGDYCPENCRWATWEEQANNRSNNRTVNIKGKSKTLAEWCREYDIDQRLVSSRVSGLGWSYEDALTTPLTNKSK